MTKVAITLSAMKAELQKDEAEMMKDQSEPYEQWRAVG
jgi:hypothetical protein